MRYTLVLWMTLSLATAGQALEFADPNLAAAVQESGADTELTQLEAGGRGIYELGGIEQLQNLTLLVLADNQVRDLRPLAALSQLTVLDLADNQVEDLAPLAGLTRLTYLNLEYNAVSDLEPLSGLDQLQVLILDHNAVRDLSPLLRLPALAELSLLGNPLSATALSQQIPALQAKGVTVAYDSPADSLEVEEETVPGAPAWRAVDPQVEPWSLGVHQLVVAPSDPEVIYALTQNGLWQSRDRGAHWARTGLMFQGSVEVFQEDLLIDAQDPLTLYWVDTDWTSWNHEMLKSRDGGRHWAPLASPIPEEDCRNNGTGYTPPYSPLIAADPVRPGRLYGAKICGDLVISGDGGGAWEMAKHQDGTPVHLEGQGFFAVHPADPQVIYAGYFHRSGRTFLSRSGDGGQTWAGQLEIRRPFRALATDPREPNTLYAVSADSVFHSGDGGQTWKPTGLMPEGNIGEVRLILVPGNPPILYAWARWYLDWGPAWRSMDHGAHWEKLPLEGVRQMVWHPRKPDQLLALTSYYSVEGHTIPGPVYRSQDQGLHWEEMLIQEKTRPAEALAFDPQGKLYVGTGIRSSKGYIPSLLQSADGGKHWSEEPVVIADSAEVALGPISRLYVDPVRPGYLWAHAKSHFPLSRDMGQHWQLVPLGLNTLLYEMYVRDSQAEILFMDSGAVFLLEPQSRKLFKSLDAGEHWTEVNVSGNPELTAAALAPGTSGRLYVSGAYDAHLWHSGDGGLNWTRISKPSLGSARALAIHPRDPGKLYGVNSLGLLVTADQGESNSLLLERGEAVWQSARVRFAPQDPRTIYVIAGRYLFETTDGGQTWKSIGEGLGARAWFNDVVVDPLDASLVYAATPWGVYRWDKDEITAVEEEGAVQPASFALAPNYPNPFNPSTTIRFTLPQPGEAELAIYNLLGQKVATLVYGMQEAGPQVLQWDGRDDAGHELASGVYFYRLQAGNRVETRKLLLLR